MRALGLLLLFLPGLAFAHEGHAHVDAAESMWTWNPLVLLPLGLSATLYAIGTARLWRHAGVGRGVRRWQALSFAGGWLFLFGALVAPLHWLGERLFAAHMVEHELLMTVAAPLIAVARPGGAMLWGLPAGWRAAMGGAMQGRAFTAVWRWLTRSAVATVIHGTALWAWHIPALYNAALGNDIAHWLQHVCFLASALLFWWALLRGEERERGYGGAVFYLFLTAAHSSFLGVLITLARREIYPLQSGAASAWSLSALQDQQLAGLIMWVLAGMVYVVMALVLAGIWIAGASSRGTGHASLR
jgi:putative membrane protein